jgi:hypothetical protein
VQNSHEINCAKHLLSLEEAIICISGSGDYNRDRDKRSLNFVASKLEIFTTSCVHADDRFVLQRLLLLCLKNWL